MTKQKRLETQFSSLSAKLLSEMRESRKDAYIKLERSVRPSTVEPLDDDKLNSSFQNRREVERDKAVTKLLQEYVNAYEIRQQDNRDFRRQMFSLCKWAVGGLICTVIASILYALIGTERDVNDIVALVTACISSIGSIAFLLDIIARYVFPSNEEDSTAKMVQTVQNNDLEERKLRYAHHKMLAEAVKQNPPVEKKPDP